MAKHSRYFDHPIVAIDKRNQLSAREQRSNILENDTLFIPCWSMDLAEKEGAKKFFVGGLDTFINYYLSLNDTKRNFYELIHNEFPVKLYFDIDIKSEKQLEEFTKYATAADVAKMLDTTLAVFFDQGDLETKIILHSCSSTKRSFHVIYPKIVFDTIKSLGYWLKTNKASFSDSGIIDFAPYNSFQSFRIHLSSKKGKNRPMTLAGFDNLNDAEKIKVSLLQHFESVDLIVYSFNTPELVPLSQTRPNNKKQKHNNPLKEDSQIVSIRTILVKNKVIPADARVYSFDGSSIVFSFSGRCELANREHASNNIKFVFYVKSMQGMYCCYDPECVSLNQTWGFAKLEPLFDNEKIRNKLIQRYQLSFATDNSNEYFMATAGTLVKPLCKCQQQRTIYISAKFMQCKGCCTSKRFTKKFMRKIFARKCNE